MSTMKNKPTSTVMKSQPLAVTLFSNTNRIDSSNNNTTTTTTSLDNNNSSSNNSSNGNHTHDQAQLKLLQAQDTALTNWSRSLVAFGSRLRWRSHFIQKFEMEVEMEYQNQCRAYDPLRTAPGDHNGLYLIAYCKGLTGYPMVDACMRALLQTGWINFRMR